MADPSVFSTRRGSGSGSANLNNITNNSNSTLLASDPDTNTIQTINVNAHNGGNPLHRLANLTVSTNNNNNNVADFLAGYPPSGIKR